VKVAVDLNAARPIVCHVPDEPAIESCTVSVTAEAGKATVAIAATTSAAKTVLILDIEILLIWGLKVCFRYELRRLSTHTRI
jgi:hypothetical protein